MRDSDRLIMEKSNFESTQEFFDMWLRTYNATMGRLVEMPAMGPTREKSEKFMKGFSTFVNLYTAGMDANSDFQSVFMEAMRRVHEKTATDEINKELYYLKKTVKELTSQIKELKEKNRVLGEEMP